MEYKELSNGVQIPVLGYGTYRIEKQKTYTCIRDALDVGYRLFDSASAYFNEEEIGKAIQDSNVDRKDIFLSTKVWIQDSGYENTLKAFETSCKNLKTDYIDLYMIHQPYADYYGSYKALEELYKQQRIKAIGISNFAIDRFVDLYLNGDIKPHVNQVEFHPFFIQNDLKDICNQYSCAIEAWGPLFEGQRNIFNHPILQTIATKHTKSIAQVVLRWHYQIGNITIPRTQNKERMKENMNIFDFVLDQEDIEKIESLNKGYSEIIDHRNYATVKALNKLKIHE